LKKAIRIFLSAVIVCASVFALGVPASAINASDRGLALWRSTSTKDGTFYIELTLNTGALPRGSNRKTKMDVAMYNSAGTCVASWDQKSYSPNTQITRTPSITLSKYPSGAYTVKVTCSLYGEEWIYNGYSPMAEERYQWTFSVTLTQPATINLSKVEAVRRDDGTYASKFFFDHSGAKGLTVYMEVYDANNRMVYKSSGTNPIAYTSGTYSFTWGGYPTNGGLKCSSGNYTIKYWLGGKNPKQSTRYLSIY